MPRAGDGIGPYTLVKRLGQGSFGEVWLARKHSAIAVTEVALKIPLEESPDIEKIRREAVVWEKAKGHPNVLPIMDADIYDGTVVIVSEYAADGSLEDALRRCGGRAPDFVAAARWMDGVLAGLEHLHGKGIVHRDLKPGNILMQGGVPRITDFGLSRVLKTSAHSGTVSGTLHYMSPEAFEGERTAASDLWAAGVILYRMVSGRYPYPYDDMARLMKAILMKAPEPLLPEVPEGLRRVVARSLERDPALRYPGAAAMRDALEGLGFRSGAIFLGDEKTRDSTTPNIDHDPAGRAAASDDSNSDGTGGGIDPASSSATPTLHDAAFASTVVSGVGPKGTKLFPRSESIPGGSTEIQEPLPGVGRDPGPSPETPSGTSFPGLVVCPLCGMKNDPRETFRCRECGTDDLCLEHQDPLEAICTLCIREQAEIDREETQNREEAEGYERVSQKEGDEPSITRRKEATQCRIEKLQREEEEKKQRGEKRSQEKSPVRLAPSHSPKAGLIWTLIILAMAGIAIIFWLIVQGKKPKEMVFVLVPAGSYKMGSDSFEAFAIEKPSHSVTISKPFEMQTTEVTQAQWKVVMGSNPSNFQDDDLPVDYVSWNDTQEFIRKINERDPGRNYRLPTEAEWEYACRAGTTKEWHGNIHVVAWYDGNSGGKTHPVGQLEANAWGLYDMLGNVWEWCSDWYGNYSPESIIDPIGPTSGSQRVFRGGSYGSDVWHTRSSTRGSDVPSNGSNRLGFRLVRDPTR